MRGVICYYSGSGNTRLACESIAARLPVPFDLVDVVRRPDVDLEPYDVVGLACWTDFWSVPGLFAEFIESLPDQSGKPAFVFNTFGGISGQTLLALGEAAVAKGFDVLAGHSLRMPESYPPMIAMGMAAAGAPSQAQLRRFDAFVATLGEQLEALRDGREPVRAEVSLGLADRFVPTQPRTKARDDMGAKTVDASACTECGRCAERCPSGAIELTPKPVFDEAKCSGCWRCYNACPSRAIHTRKFRGKPLYSGPSEQLKRKLDARG